MFKVIVHSDEVGEAYYYNNDEAVKALNHFNNECKQLRSQGLIDAYYVELVKEPDSPFTGKEFTTA